MRAVVWRITSRSRVGLAARRPALPKNRRLPRAEDRFPLTVNEPAQLLRRTQAAQRLQSRDRLRSRRMAAHADREPDFSVLRYPELGSAPSGVAPHNWFSHRADPCLGV